MCSGNSKAYTPEEWLAHYARDVARTFAEMRRAAAARGAPTTNYLFCADFGGGGGVLWHMRDVVPLLKLLTKEVASQQPNLGPAIVTRNTSHP